VIARRLLPAAVCALATHALLYGSLTPADGLHGYFGWYEPAVAALSFAALLGLVALVAAASLVPRLRCALAGRLAPRTPVGVTARSLGAASLAFLLAQESLERSIASGQPAFVVLSPSQWLMVLAGVGLCSTALALALRAGRVATARLLAQPRLRPLRAFRPGWSVTAAVSSGRPRPLAERFGLRAPPLLAG